MDVNQPPIPEALVPAVDAAAAAEQPDGDDLLDLADELTYALEGALPYLNVVKVRPTADPRRRLMGTSFCPRVKGAGAVVDDLGAALAEGIHGLPARTAGFALGDQAYLDFVLGDGDGAVTGRLRVTVYG